MKLDKVGASLDGVSEFQTALEDALKKLDVYEKEGGKWYRLKAVAEKVRLAVLPGRVGVRPLCPDADCARLG